MEAHLTIVARKGTGTYALYQYTPSLPLAIIAAAAFLLTGVVHALLVRKLRARTFIPFAVGCFMEAVGYGGRCWSHFASTSIPAFVIQSLLILIAPALFAASIYMVLGRLIALIDGEKRSVIPLRFLTKLFVIGDCLSFFVQICGGGLQAAGTLQFMNMGEKIIVAGLFIQLFFFGIFLITAIIFHTRMNANPTPASLSPCIPWTQTIWVLYIGSVIILMRSVFRVVEYLMGNDGWILQHEFMLYSLDTLLMLLVAILFMVKHPAKLFLTRNRDSETEFPTMKVRYDRV